MNQFQYVKVKDVKSAVGILSREPAAKFLAGGTNLLDLMKKGIAQPEKLVDINGLPLKKIAHQGKLVSIGSLVLNSDAADDEIVTSKFPLLSLALNAGASPQLRNMATVGGNILQRTRCSYFYDIAMPCNKRQPGTGCGALQGYNRMHGIFGTEPSCIAVHPSDMCVALSALDATLVINGLKGERRMLLNDFLRLPGDAPQKDNNLGEAEIITAVEIPYNKYARNSYYLKIRDRSSYAFALVSVAAALDITNGVINSVRLAVGGVAHKPWRLYESEKFLAGKKISESNFFAAAELAIKGAKAYEHNGFKVKLLATSVAEALKKAAANL